MGNYIEFEDYTIEVKNVIREKCIEFLQEIGGEVRSMTQRYSRRKTSQTAGSYEYMVDTDNLAVHVGSNFDNAVWEEFGTGIHAVHGDGRPTAWRYKDKRTGKWYTTRGKTANRPLQRAFEYVVPKAEAYAQRIFGGI